LAEVQWTHRRAFSYGAAGALIFLLGGIVLFRTDDPEVLKPLGLAFCGLIALVTLVYVAGATATDIARIIEARGRGK
jgi:endo-1,4-beta-mannosidase